MAGILNAAAQQIKANTAGHTYQVGEAPNPGQPVAGTLTETVRRIIPTANGALDHLFRMEPSAAPVASAAEAVPTTATTGPHGGAVPAALSHLFAGAPAPGPGPGPVAHPVGPEQAYLGQSNPLLPGGGTPIHVAQIPTDIVGAGKAATGTAIGWLGWWRRRLGV